MRWVAGAMVVVMVACSQKPAPRRYNLEGQVLAVDAQKQELTVKHGDIPNFMPAMTMTYPVASPNLLKDRTPGELISAVLEVDDATGRLVEIKHTGASPLPQGTNEVAMAEGLLAEGDQAPDAAFIDQNNKRVSFSDWKGTVTVLTFIYTSCPLPEFCPLMEKNFVEIQRAISGSASLKGQVKLVAITFDPGRDTPAVLAAHAKAHAADPAIWTFLTGDPATIDRFAGRFGVSLVRTGDATEIEHNLRTAIIDRTGRITKIYPGNEWKPAGALADIRAALGTR